MAIALGRCRRSLETDPRNETLNDRKRLFGPAADHAAQLVKRLRGVQPRRETSSRRPSPAGAAYLLGYGAMFALVAGMAAAEHRRRAARSAKGTSTTPSPAGPTTRATRVDERRRHRRAVPGPSDRDLHRVGGPVPLRQRGDAPAGRPEVERRPEGRGAAPDVGLHHRGPARDGARRPAGQPTRGDSWGRKPVFLIGFAVLPVRGLLYCLSVNPYYLVAVQLLDGIGAGIFGVVSVLVVADLTRGTGRFNLTQGALATATGVGAGARATSSPASWSRRPGFNAGFLTLAAIAAAATSSTPWPCPRPATQPSRRGSLDPRARCSRPPLLEPAKQPAA